MISERGRSEGNSSAKKSEVTSTSSTSSRPSSSRMRAATSNRLPSPSQAMWYSPGTASPIRLR